MKITRRLVLTSLLALTACQNVPVKTAEIIKAELPTTKINGDSDQDGVPDDIDQCPNTPLNVIVDERGCPVSRMTDMDYNRIDYRVFYPKNQSFPELKYISELEKLVKIMKTYPTTCFYISGYASKAEKDEIGTGISLARALTIKQLLKEKYSIDDKRLTVESFGYQRPIADDSTIEGQALNQRVFGILATCKK